jgi:hypothetical protein
VGEDALLEVTHATPLLQAAYTMRLHRRGREVRFWIDTTRPHDIEDAWGFLRVEPTADGRSLVTYGVLVDMGGGLLRDLFEERVRRAALSLPERLRDVAALERATGGTRAFH